MFSFVTRWFGGKGKDTDAEKKADEPAKDTPYQKGDPVPYSMEFIDAEEIVISARDCTRKNVDAIMRHVVRPHEITKISELLNELPREGEQTKQENPCAEHTLTAFKENIPFATVTFYDKELKLENGLFILSGEDEIRAQRELFELIKVEVGR